jgi:cobyrinic acid a,c-diamide synthase
MAALAKAGWRVAPAKVGPDFIDPQFHELATGRSSVNLDPVLAGEPQMRAQAAESGAGADLLLVEGVMGLFDGQVSRDPVPALASGSTAAVALALSAPVVLVIDCAGMGQSVVATVVGFHRHYQEVGRGEGVAGLILNRVAGSSHAEILIDAISPTGIPVLGWLPRDPALSRPSRHLGLVGPNGPGWDGSGWAGPESGVTTWLATLSARMAEQVDLAAVVGLARQARPVGPIDDMARPRHVGRAQIAVAGGPGFSFCYRETLLTLTEAGADLVEFDPAVDEYLPPGTAGLYLPGGYPELIADELAANESLRNQVKQFIHSGLPTLAECGGMLYLAESLDDRPMCGSIPGRASLSQRAVVGYRQVQALAPSLLLDKGESVVGHEHHYAQLDPAGEGFMVAGRNGAAPAGFTNPSATLMASFVHLYLRGWPVLAERFVARAAQRSRSMHWVRSTDRVSPNG